ncbi:ATP-dependent translocase ABCB1-like isoform X2 [Bacillus rossius redtenbacheri]|uniref:ATP-dependent translocase ABCB1-like isoform X2 n=1 Tax=Bacillus rossius redtenbacheri TaxID=93214 RepID=UPI002FDDEEAB
MGVADDEKLSLLKHGDKHDGKDYMTADKCRRKSEDEVSHKSGVWGLFRYASKCDVALMSVGLLFAVLHGASFPVLAMVFGRMTNTFIVQATQGFRSNFTSEDVDVTESSTIDSINNSGTSTLNWTSPFNSSSESGSSPWMSDKLSPEEFRIYMSQFSLYYLFIGVGVLCAAFVQTLCWEIACERQVYRLRQIFFAQMLRQDISWYDKNQSGDLTIKLSDDLERIREGIGAKFSMVLQYVATFVSGLVVGLIANWLLTLVILAVAPVLIGTSAYMAKIAASSAAREQLKYSIAGGIAEEVLCSIRTVAAFGGQDRETLRYKEALEKGLWLAMKKYYVLSVGIGGVFFVTYGAYGLAFWYGAELVGNGTSTPGSVFTVFFSVMSGAFSLGNALPFVNAVSTAVGAASTIFDIIDRVPDIDAFSEQGKKLDKVKGSIEFKNVFFAYPARQSVEVLKDFNLSISSGKTVALVGSSGAGKSTVGSLLLRFYDPTKGQVLLDGVDIKDLNLSWLRAQIGVVSQEPCLFGVSILENIRYGHSDVSMQDVVNAAMMANAHGFISSLPMGYDTLVGDRGAQLSGGQKQRVAIARALVRDPRILLLDEATSALDAHSEGVVQEALDKAMQGRTTVIIAHRLSTVRGADVIYALKNGLVLEWGTHTELMAKNGLYHDLVTTQTSGDDGEVICSGDHTGPELQRQLSSCSSHGPRQRRREHRSLSLSMASLQDPELEHLAQAVEESKPEDIGFLRIFLFNAPEWLWLVGGFIGCMCTGAIMPVFAFFYGEVFATFTLTGEELRSTALFWTLMFVVLAVCSGVSYWLQVVCMATAAEKMVLRLRLCAFANIIRQPVGWFDLETSSAGRLITRLARDAPLVKAAAGLRAGQVLGAFVTLLAAMLIAFLYGWKLALLLTIAVPVIAGASYQQMLIIRRNQRRDAELMDEAGRVASESVQNIRTVQSLGKELLFCELYLDSLIAPYLEAKKQAFVYALVFAFSQAVIYVMYAGAFRFAAYLIENGDMETTNVYRVFFALAFCAASVGQASAYLQDYTKAKLAAGLLFQLIDRKSEISTDETTGSKPEIAGKVRFEDVRFRYPSRPDVEVLRGLSFALEPGHTLALVGASGCGKSTVVALLERFYDPTGGAVYVDDHDIRTLNLPHLRNHIGLVTQEPVLFDCSIRDNIAYGATDPNVKFADIMAAAREANIHDFIVNLPEGYDTMVGERGTQLSGGQKQRVAIARALVRNPRILLLDEATSALDTESEKVVQEALDRARKGRTCIVIAHRLSTIHNADTIAVVHRGRVAELGTHDELRARRGRYHQLIRRQQL